MNLLRVIEKTSLLVAVAAMLAACGGPASDNSTAVDRPATPASTEPRYGGNVIIGSVGEPVNFNPAYFQDTASGDVADLLFSGLVKINERLGLEPDVAVAMPEVTDDGLVWTYQLRQDVLFHDGVELTADDIVFTFDVYMHPEYTGPRAGSYKSIQSVEAVDDHTVRFTLSEPDAKFEQTAGTAILPKHLLEDIPIADLGDYREFNVDGPIGTGPFKFVEWTRGQSLSVEAFEDYFDGRPYLDRVTFRFISNQSAGVLLLETGEIDHLVVPVTELATVEAMPHVTVSSTLALRYDYIGWNLRNPLFADRRVRQALTHAVDRQEIVDTILEGKAQVAHAPTSPLFEWAYSDDMPKFPYDPGRAKALLAEAGWTPGPDGILQKDGQRFSFEMLSNDGNVIRRDLAVIVQQYLGAIGIEVRPAQMEWGAFLSRIQAPNWDFDSVVLAWALGTDPDPRPIWHSSEIPQGLNNVAFSNPRVDELADLNLKATSRPERAKILQELWRVVAEEQPYMFLYQPMQFIGLKSDIRGFIHHPRSDMYNTQDWWLDR